MGLVCEDSGMQQLCIFSQRQVSRRHWKGWCQRESQQGPLKWSEGTSAGGIQAGGVGESPLRGCWREWCSWASQQGMLEDQLAITAAGHF